MLIDCSFFTKGSRRILNASMGTLPNANAREVCETIQSYIAENQERYLTEMLGPHLGNRFNTYLVCLDEDVDAKRIETMDAVCERLRESFADYVFFHILRDANTQSTITGLVQLKNANSYVSPIRRQVGIWNSMVEKNRLFAAWCDSSECAISGISISSDMMTKINSFNI